jgi:phytoene dehydrogenase-like protein
LSQPVVVIGAGIGGLAAALRLARTGIPVRLIEGRDGPGGLASDVLAGGLRFDGGPYIVLDRPGLEWAFAALGLSLDGQLALRPIDDVYEVVQDDDAPLRFLADLEATSAGFERRWPGSGRRYVAFVRTMEAAYARLRPLLFVSHPGALDLLRTGAWRQAPLLLRSLRDVLGRAGLPRPLAEAVAVWTHVAGQRPDQAPAFLAFVPALIHGVGACYPLGGIGTLPEVLARAATAAGVEIEYDTTVTAIRAREGEVEALETSRGVIAARTVISDVGLSTYLDLLDPLPDGVRRRLGALPLQSPGLCAYLRVRGPKRPPYLRFRVGVDGCRLFVASGLLEEGGDGWTARLLSPLDHAAAARDEDGDAAERLDRLLAEPWWRESLAADVVATRTPATWGSQFYLHRNAMNPVMTAAFMRRGRLPHRSPYVRGLYMAGAATHPGQWLSFCAISGVLAADCVLADRVGGRA